MFVNGDANFINVDLRIGEQSMFVFINPWSSFFMSAQDAERIKIN